MKPLEQRLSDWAEQRGMTRVRFSAAKGGRVKASVYWPGGHAAHGFGDTSNHAVQLLGYALGFEPDSEPPGGSPADFQVSSD